MILESARIALSGLQANRMRSALTMLGVLIGTMSVILLLAVGAGAERFTQREIAALGSNTIFVTPGSEADISGGSAVGGPQGRAPAVTDADVRELRQRSTAIERVVPSVSTSVTATSGGRSLSIPNFVGSTADYATVLPTAVASGVLFTEADVRQRRRVAVIGDTVADRLLPGGSPVGQVLSFNGAKFEVIAVLAERGGGIAGDQDNRVLAPLTAVQDTITGRQPSYSQVIVTPRSAGLVDTATDEIRSILRAQHGIPEPPVGQEWKDDFTVFDSQQFTESARQISIIFTVMLGGIAGISLLVGGIGVMNIMLVTVTERTREIGIRKALGAHRRHLLGQFLIEAVILTLLGGTVGIVLGVGLAQIRVGGFNPVVQPYAIALGFGVSVASGVFFGVVPAYRASRLRPIEALRHE